MTSWRTAWPTTVTEARRFMADVLPRSAPVEGTADELGRYATNDEAPALVEPSLIEGDEFRAVDVPGANERRGESGFTAFLDGAQQVAVVNQLDGVPIVWGTVSAAVRVRVNRRLASWGSRPPLVRRRYYLPFRYVGGLPPGLIGGSGIVDTATPDATGAFPSRHPAALLESAINCVRRDRERLEEALAEEWCASEHEPLYIDGSITGSAPASDSPLAVGVIKTHRRLYADGDAFGVLMSLRAGQRSTVFRVSPRGRNAVASWYLRVRNAAGRDALFGLVRVEVAERGDLESRADEVSRWVVAEGAPLSLPDGRWDKMAYGIRHTEEFLRAVT